ncbi:3964_t:CDS:2, partial [Cetraspora pellucida]
GLKMDPINDVWTVVGAHYEDANMESFVSFSTVIGFKHQKTGVCLHSHGTCNGVTPKSKYQQDRNGDDDWLIRRFTLDTSYVDEPNLKDEEESCLKNDDDPYLMNNDVISLFHISTGKPALYSHSVLLNDGSQEVCCRGNGSDENNKWPLIN